MSERLDRLLREIAIEKELALAELGLAVTGPVLVPGALKPADVIAQRLAKVPAPLREDVRTQMLRQLVVLPWLQTRAVSGARA